MITGVKQFPRAVLFSTLLHVGLLILVFVSLDSRDDRKLIKQGEQVKTVKAEVVDRQQLEARERKKQAEIDKKKKAREAEIERKAEAEKKKQLEAKRKIEQKKKLEEKKKAAARKKEAEKQKKELELKRQQEQELARQAEEKRKVEEARIKEEKRKAEEIEKQKAEQLRIAEEAQKRKQAELKAQMQAEESQRLKSNRDAYRTAIQQKIERNWLRPQESGKIPDCEVRVLQGPGGIIMDVTFGSCSGGTATYRASIENAVYKAEPLPQPNDPALFERELIMLFKPR